MAKSNCKVCVAGGAGFIGSWLVHKLLDKGYTVHATLRNLDDKSKVDFLKSFPDAKTRLLLFEADLFDPDKFENAIQGCEFVFHVATPMPHTEGTQLKNTTGATVAAARSIAKFCVRSGTVRRLIYTSSLASASPITEDGSGFKDLMDETCWTPLNLPFDNLNHYLREYLESKTETEKEILSHANGGGLEVIVLNLGAVGGDTALPYSYLPSGVMLLLSQLMDMQLMCQQLKHIQELLGKLPIVHIDDVCEAHIFCVEKPSNAINGRFFCACDYVSSAEIASYYQQNYPEFHVKPEYLNVQNREIKWGGTKLMEIGFEYKYETKKILDDSIKCARRTGFLLQ